MKKIIVYIKNKTGEVKRLNKPDITSFDDDREESGIKFQWTDGNFGCDCNRGLLFSNSEEEYPCGEEYFSSRV